MQMDSTLSIEKDALVEAIRLPEAAVKGLVPIQIQQMKETAIGVNEAYGVAGSAMRSACEQLYALKKNLKRGNWMAFIKSGVLDVSEKQASDWVSAYENWLMQDTNVPDSLLAGMTSRTAAAIGNAQPETRQEVMSKLLSGVKPSENQVRKIISEAEPTKKKKSKVEQAQADNKPALLKKEKNVLIIELDAAMNEIERLKKENSKLKEELASMGA